MVQTTGIYRFEIPLLYNLNNLNLLYKEHLMTTLAIRKKLMTYLADADDSTIKAIYTLLKNDMQEEDSFKLTEEQLQILNEEEIKYLKGEGKSYTREEADQIARNLRDF